MYIVKVQKSRLINLQVQQPFMSTNKLKLQRIDIQRLYKIALPEQIFIYLFFES